MKLIAFDNKILPSENQNHDVNPEHDCVTYGLSDGQTPAADIMKRVLTLFDDQSRRYENLPPKWRKFKYDWHDFKYFVVGLAYQMMLPKGEGFKNAV